MSDEIVTKSMIAKAVAEAKGLPVIDIPLSNVPAGAFLGVPRPRGLILGGVPFAVRKKG